MRVVPLLETIYIYSEVVVNVCVCSYGKMAFFLLLGCIATFAFVYTIVRHVSSYSLKPSL